jgi:hypothetical protein
VQIVLFRFWLLGFGASAVVWRSELNTVIFFYSGATALFGVSLLIIEDS